MLFSSLSSSSTSRLIGCWETQEKLKRRTIFFVVLFSKLKFQWKENFDGGESEICSSNLLNLYQNLSVTEQEVITFIAFAFSLGSWWMLKF